MTEARTGNAAGNAGAAARFATRIRFDDLPAAVVDAARMCFVDWLGCAIAGHGEGAAVATRRVVASWGGSGQAAVLLDGATNAAAAALVNGTMAHCLDFDDTHVGSLAHLSGPTWAAAFSLGTDRAASPRDMIRAFVVGFEIGGRFGGGRFGDSLNERGLHSTGIVGCMAAAAAAGALLDLDEGGFQRAFGAAATQAAGLTASFGTMAKPFHAGKAAFNGVLSAELAQAGFLPARGLIEPEGGIAAALVQDGGAHVPAFDFSAGWEILRNTFKPYAACLLTHPVIDAARQLSRDLDVAAIEHVRVGIHPMAQQLAGIERPSAPLEGKFSTAFCTALALSGRAVSATDFGPETLADAGLQALARRVELVVEADRPKTSAWLEVTLGGGGRLRADIPLALGNPENPMSWEAMRAKFAGLVEPVLGMRAAEAFEHARRFETPDDVAAIARLRK